MSFMNLFLCNSLRNLGFISRGGWIRTIAGRAHYRWRKSARQKQRFKHHVVCNGQQSWMLDTMVTSFWRRPKHYVEDPYAPYHTRDYFKCKTKPYN